VEYLLLLITIFCSSAQSIISKQYNIKSKKTNSFIACAVNLSQTYFHTIFTASVGCSPHEYLIKCRIENAKKMLWNSENELKDIAVICGFGCQQYMNKVFKQQTGLTPGQYRKSVQNNYLL